MYEEFGFVIQVRPLHKFTANRLLVPTGRRIGFLSPLIQLETP